MPPDVPFSGRSIFHSSRLSSFGHPTCGHSFSRCSSSWSVVFVEVNSGELLYPAIHDCDIIIEPKRDGADSNVPTGQEVSHE